MHADDPTDDLAARFARDAGPALAGLYRHAFKLTLDHTDAEDLLQDTAARAYASFATFRPGTNLTGWLYRILVNTHFSNYRKQQRRPGLLFTDEFTDGLLLAHHRRCAGSPRSAEDQVLALTGDHDVDAAMRRLPEKYRTAVFYADVEGLRCGEIAALTKVPVGTVLSRLHRGRRQLRRALVDVARHRGYPTAAVAA